MILGSICAAISGGVMPVFVIMSGLMTQKFKEGPDAIEAEGRRLLMIFIYIGAGAFIAGWGMYASWMITGERQSIKCRK